MQIETATNAKNQFGALLDTAIREPVLIQRSGRNVAVMLGYDTYESLVDSVWGKQASQAKKEGFLSEKASRNLINSILDV